MNKIKNNKACQSFELFIRTYYLSKKHSYLTILRQNVGELYNFGDEYVIPLNFGIVEDLYDSSTLVVKFRKTNSFPLFSFLPSQEKTEEFEVIIQNNNW